MSKLYSASGRPIDILKREAKALSKKAGIRHRKALDATAASEGFVDWDDLHQRSLWISEITPYLDGDVEPPYLVMANTQDEIHYLPESPEFFLEYNTHINEDDVAEIFLETNLSTFCDDNYRTLYDKVEIGVFIHSRQSAMRRGIENSTLFTPKVGFGKDDYFTAAMETSSGNHSRFLNMLWRDGVFDFDLSTNLRFHAYDYEAFLILEMRKLGLMILGEQMFGLPTPEGEPTKAERASAVHCSAHRLSDGRILMSNCKGPGELDWKVIDRSEFKELDGALVAELGKKPAQRYQDEDWMHERVFSKG